MNLEELKMIDVKKIKETLSPKFKIRVFEDSLYIYNELFYLSISKEGFYYLVNIKKHISETGKFTSTEEAIIFIKAL